MRTSQGSGGGRTAAPAPLHLLRKSSLLFSLSFSFLLASFSFSSAAELPHVYALVNAHVVTAPGKVIDKGTVIVRGGEIVAVGASGAVAVPADAQVLDLEGDTVSPGLIDPYVTVSRLSGVRPAAVEMRLRMSRIMS